MNSDARFDMTLALELELDLELEITHHKIFIIDMYFSQLNRHLINFAVNANRLMDVFMMIALDYDVNHRVRIVCRIFDSITRTKMKDGGFPSMI